MKRNEREWIDRTGSLSVDGGKSEFIRKGRPLEKREMSHEAPKGQN